MRKSTRPSLPPANPVSGAIRSSFLRDTSNRTFSATWATVIRPRCTRGFHGSRLQRHVRCCRRADSMQSPQRRLACAETWAGNNETATLVELPGLTAWVYSVPVGPDHVGGDVHYLS